MWIHKKRICFFVGCLILFSSVLLRPYTANAFDSVEIPPECGSVVNSYSGAPGKVVFIVSDIHDSYEVQENIMRTLDFLINYYDIALLGLEGGKGVIDIGGVRSYYNKEVKEKVSTYYMQNGRIGGGLTFALVSDKAVTALGLEDVHLYEASVTLFRNTYQERMAVIEQITSIREILERFKMKVFPRELRMIDRYSTEYHTGALSLIEYAEQLIRSVRYTDFSFSQFPNIALLDTILTIEEKIDYSFISSEQSALLEDLREAIGTKLDDLTLLESQAAAFDDKKITEETYFTLIYSLVLKYGLDVQKYPNVWSLIKSISLMKKIDSIVLADETLSVYPLIQEVLLPVSLSEHAREMIQLLHRLDVLEKIVLFTAAHTQTEEYFSQPNLFASSHFISFIRENARKYDVPFRIHPKIVLIDKVLPLVKEFYTLQQRRSMMFAETLTREIERRTASFGVLVVGSLHVKDIEKYFENKNVSFVTITPALRRLTRNIPITSRLLGTDDRLESYLMHGGSFLKPWNGFSPLVEAEHPYLTPLLNWEFIVTDLMERLSGEENLSSRAVTKAICVIDDKMHQAGQTLKVRPVSVMESKVLDKRFVEIATSSDAHSIRLFFEPIKEREASYADDKTHAIPALNDNRLEKGIYKVSTALEDLLSNEYGLITYRFNESLCGEIQREYKKEQAEKEAQVAAAAPPEPSAADLSAIADMQTYDKKAIEEKIKHIKQIEYQLNEKKTLEELNDLSNHFLLLKSQLYLYVLLPEQKDYLVHVEDVLSRAVNKSISEMRERKKHEEDEQEKLRKRKLLELQIEEESRIRAEQEKIKRLVDAIQDLQGEIDAASNLVQLSRIEDRFNMLVADISFDDLNPKSTHILQQFKETWEKRFVSIQNTLSEKHYINVTSFGEKDIGSVIHTMYALKELIDIATLPEDADFILKEFTTLKEKVDFSQVTEEVRAIFNEMEQYLTTSAEAIRAGKKRPQQSLLQSIKPQDEEAVIDSSVEELFKKIYTIRAQALVPKSMDALKALEKEFNEIDSQLQNAQLTEYHKEVLADTQRIINEAIQRFIMRLGHDQARMMREREHQKQSEKETLLKELLGESYVEADKKQTILLIEKNKFERQVIVDRLEKEGFIVRALSSYAVPLTFFDQNRVGCMLLSDTIIDGLAGIDFVEELMKEARTHSIKLPTIIFHTNSSVSWLRERLRRINSEQQTRIFVVSKRNLQHTIDYIRKALSLQEDQ